MIAYLTDVCANNADHLSVRQPVNAVNTDTFTIKQQENLGRNEHQFYTQN